MASARGNIGAQFAKHFTRGEILVPHLNNWFLAAEFPDEIELTLRPNKEKDGAFHPSSALACERALFAKLRGELPEEMTRLDMEKVFMIGRFYHELIQWIVVDQLGFSTWDQVEKRHEWDFVTAAGNPYKVVGFPDVARMDIPGQPAPVLLDIKTQAARLYGMNRLPGGLGEKYEAQTRIYLEFEDLDTAILLMCEKDNPHRFREVVVERDGAEVDRIVDGWDRVADALVDEDVPGCTCPDPKNCPARDLYG